MKDQVVRVKNFAIRNKAALAVAAVTIPVIVAQHRGIRSMEAFLISKDLHIEYFTPEAIGE